MKVRKRAAAPRTGADSSGLDFAGHASEFWLAAHWKKPLGQGLDAALGFRAAAELWAKAADILERTAAAESFRQRMNRTRAFIEAGDLPRANQAAKAAAERLEPLQKRLPEQMESVRTEWLELLETLRSAQREFKADCEAMRAEIKETQADDLTKLSADTVRHWLQRYPGLARSHFVAYRVAEGRKDWKSAKKYLEAAITLEPEHDTFRVLYLNLLPHVEQQPERVWSAVDEEFHRIENQSATVCFIYALLSLELRKAPGRDSSDGWEIAARELRRAIERPVAEMSLALWGWACVVRQYCRWKLNTPGVATPFTSHLFARGPDVWGIDLTSLGAKKDHAAVEAELRARAESAMPKTPAA